MSFFNALREDDQRDIRRKKLQGWVTKSTDPMKLQRVQVRIHDLHYEIADADLPWFSPNQLAAYSGAANVGDHGPIPQVGTKIWVEFDDASQYHGTYGGGVTTTTNQIPEFTASGNGVTLPGGSSYDFHQNYPASNGSVDGSGSISGSDEHTDTVTNIHVSGTGHAIDGKGNVSHVVNGNATRSDNPNASSLFSKGLTSAIFGGMTLYVSGNLSVSVGGNADIECSGTINMNASQVNINNSSPSVTAPSAPTPRSRPNPTITPNDEKY